MDTNDNVKNMDESETSVVKRPSHKTTKNYDEKFAFVKKRSNYEEEMNKKLKSIADPSDFHLKVGRSNFSDPFCGIDPLTDAQIKMFASAHSPSWNHLEKSGLYKRKPIIRFTFDVGRVKIGAVVTWQQSPLHPVIILFIDNINAFKHEKLTSFEYMELKYNIPPLDPQYERWDQDPKNTCYETHWKNDIDMYNKTKLYMDMAMHMYLASVFPEHETSDPYLFYKQTHPNEFNARFLYGEESVPKRIKDSINQSFGASVRSTYSSENIKRLEEMEKELGVGIHNSNDDKRLFQQLIVLAKYLKSRFGSVPDKINVEIQSKTFGLLGSKNQEKFSDSFRVIFDDERTIHEDTSASLKSKLFQISNVEKEAFIKAFPKIKKRRDAYRQIGPSGTLIRRKNTSSFLDHFDSDFLSGIDAEFAAQQSLEELSKSETQSEHRNSNNVSTAANPIEITLDDEQSEIFPTKHQHEKMMMTSTTNDENIHDDGNGNTIKTNENTSKKRRRQDHIISDDSTSNKLIGKDQNSLSVVCKEDDDDFDSLEPVLKKYKKTTWQQQEEQHHGETSVMKETEISHDIGEMGEQNEEEVEQVASRITSNYNKFLEYISKKSSLSDFLEHVYKQLRGEDELLKIFGTSHDILQKIQSAIASSVQSLYENANGDVVASASINDDMDNNNSEESAVVPRQQDAFPIKKCDKVDVNFELREEGNDNVETIKADDTSMSLESKLSPILDLNSNLNVDFNLKSSSVCPQTNASYDDICNLRTECFIPLPHQIDQNSTPNDFTSSNAQEESSSCEQKYQENNTINDNNQTSSSILQGFGEEVKHEEETTIVNEKMDTNSPAEQEVMIALSTEILHKATESVSEDVDADECTITKTVGLATLSDDHNKLSRTTSSFFKQPTNVAATSNKKYQSSHYRFGIKSHIMTFKP